MKKHLLLASVVFAMMPASLWALNITIFDGVSGGNFGGGPTGPGLEDQEVEAGAGQKWDLEVFDLTGSTVTLWVGRSAMPWIIRLNESEYSETRLKNDLEISHTPRRAERTRPPTCKIELFDFV